MLERNTTRCEISKQLFEIDAKDSDTISFVNDLMRRQRGRQAGAPASFPKTMMDCL